MTKNQQLIYGWIGEPKPIPVKHEDAEVPVVKLEDFVRFGNAAEAAMGQKILQDNQEAERIDKLVADAALVNLPTNGTATVDQLAAQNNAINSILTSLVISGKQRG